MEPVCDAVPVPSLLLALTQEELPRAQIPMRILAMFDIVYAWIRNAPVRQTGHNHAIYDRCTATTLRMRVGFPVSGPFADTDLVQCVQLSPGQAAHAVHLGSYATLHDTYARLHAWCAEQGHTPTGQSWEVYDDPSANPADLRTDLFLRIDAQGAACAASGP